MKVFLSILVAVAAMASVHADPLVAAVQTKLTRLGYYNGQADGAWGSQTAAAVRRFQVAQELRVTGELNPATLNALGLKSAPAPRPAPEVDPGKALADIFVGGPYLNAPPEF